MKTKQSIWKKKLVKTTTFATALVVAFTMLFGSAAAVGYLPSQNEVTIQPVAGNIAPHNSVPLTTDSDETPYVSSPYRDTNSPSGPLAIWDIQAKFDLSVASGANGNAGAEFDGTYLYTGRWASNLFHKYTKEGALVSQFSITGVSAIRDLAFDGTYMYGGAASTTIYKMDFNTQTLVSSWTTTVAVRAIEYDPVADGFWVADFTSAISLVSRTGAIIRTIAKPTVFAGMYGFAYDDVSAGGPYLWIFDQTTGATNTIYQMNIATGLLTGVTHNVEPDVNNAGIAGGLFATTDFVPGKFSVGGCSQGVPDYMIVYEVATTVTLDHDVGMVSIDAPVTGTATQATVTPKATVKNSGANTETFPVTLKIVEETAIYTTMYTEGFEGWVPRGSVVFPPAGWTRLNTNGGNQWLAGTGTSYPPYRGFYCAYVNADTTPNNDSLISPSIAIPAVSPPAFTFYYRGMWSFAPETFQVYYNDGITNTLLDTITTYKTSYQLYSKDMTAFAGTTGKFEVRYISNDWYRLYVDAFTFPDGTKQGFEASGGYFAGTPNWESIPIAGTSTSNYWQGGTSASSVYPDHNPHAGTYMAWYNCYMIPSGCIARLVMSNPVDLSSYAADLLHFKFWIHQSSTYNYQDKVALKMSLDNGATWKTLGEWRQYDVAAPVAGQWYQKVVSLLGYETATSALFAFDVTCANWGDITIDDITIDSVQMNVLYTDTKTVTGLAPNTQAQVTFAVWTLPGWGNPLYENTAVKFNLKATTGLVGDEKSSNDVMLASPIITYPFLHDVGISAINSPGTSGVAQPSYPVSYTMKNYGATAEHWFYNMITVDNFPGGDFFARDFSDSVSAPEWWGPNGWIEEQVLNPSANNNFLVVTSGTLPTCSPHSSPSMAEYNSYSAYPYPASSRLSTPIMNLSGLGEVRGKFWMYHDTGYATNQENIQWQYSLNDGASWIDVPGAKFMRSVTLMGVTAAGWYEWKIDLSAITNLPSVRIGLLATGYYGNNMFFDDLRIIQLSTSTNLINEAFTYYSTAGYTFGPGWTKTQTNAQTWKIAGTTAATFYATCTEVGATGVQNEKLTSPTIDCTGQSTPVLKFYRYFYLYTTPDSTVTIQGSIDGGLNYNYPIAFWNTAQTPGAVVSYSCPWAANQANVTVQFWFQSTSDSYAYDYVNIDDILFTDVTEVEEFNFTAGVDHWIQPGESVDFTPGTWIPLHFATGLSGTVKYQISATTLLGTDTNLINNNMVKTFTLTYNHDLAVTEITEPSAPARPEYIIKYYSSYPPVNAVGLNSAATWESAMRCTPTLLSPYDGYNLIAVKFYFYMTDTISGSVKIYDGGTTSAPGALLGQKSFTVTGAGMKRVDLDAPVYVDASADMWVSVEWIQTVGTSYWPAGVDAGPAVAGCGIWAYLNSAWQDLNAAYGMNYNWCLEAIVTEGGPHAEFYLGPGTYPVEGTIKNLGTFTETGTAKATVYDVMHGSAIVYQSYYPIASIGVGAEVSAAFADWTVTAAGLYNLSIEMPLANDDKTSNNYMELGIGIDDTAPVSTHTVSPATPNGQNSWYVSDVTITLQATDDLVGVKVIKYQIDGGSWLDYTGPIVISTDSASHVVKYYAIDKVGNEESPAHEIPAFKMDKTAPTITLAGDHSSKTEWVFTATVADPMSGVTKVEFYVADVLLSTVMAPGPYTFTYTGKDTPCQAIVYDNAGNSAVSAEVESFTTNEVTTQSHSSSAVVLKGLIKGL
jgi:hypothetical protein